MLRNCEADLRRELLKTQSKPNESPETVINRKESFETAAAPSSPVKVTYTNGNGGRFSPRKTHLTNFINQNMTPAEMLRRQSSGEAQNAASANEAYESKMKRSPCLQFNHVRMTPPKSPMPRRRFRSQSPRVCIESDSDSDTLNGNTPGNVVQKKAPLKRTEMNKNKENKLRHTWRKSRQSVEQDDIVNRNTIPMPEVDALESTDHRPFRSIDMAHRVTETFYCPQSEPLKRKIYSEKTLDRLQKSLDMESGMSCCCEPLFITNCCRSQKFPRRRCSRRFPTCAVIASNSIDRFRALNKSTATKRHWVTAQMAATPTWLRLINVSSS